MPYFASLRKGFRVYAFIVGHSVMIDPADIEQGAFPHPRAYAVRKELVGAWCRQCGQAEPATDDATERMRRTLKQAYRRIRMDDRLPPFANALDRLARKLIGSIFFMGTYWPYAQGPRHALAFRHDVQSLKGKLLATLPTELARLRKRYPDIFARRQYSGRGQNVKLVEPPSQEDIHALARMLRGHLF